MITARRVSALALLGAVGLPFVSVVGSVLLFVVLPALALLGALALAGWTTLRLALALGGGVAYRRFSNRTLSSISRSVPARSPRSSLGSVIVTE
jgi:hypothetical protein